jgi:acyl-coenzyme A synthetase/AMP-(fatty) acid ligase
MDTPWYKDGELNICYYSSDKHIGMVYGDQIALIYDLRYPNRKKNIIFRG